MPRNPDVPWDNKREYSEVIETKALSGLTKRYVAYRGQALRTFSSPYAAADEITIIESWWDAIEEGTKPFVYIETPNTAPKAMMMIMDTPELSFELVGPTERSLTFDLSEQPPYLARE